MIKKYNKPNKIFAKSDESPIVFSRCQEVNFKEEVTGEEVKTRLIASVESIKQWVLDNNYFIGHIKIFADLGDGDNLWISITDIVINAEQSFCDETKKVKSCSISLTAILFGTDEESLKAAITHSVNKNMLQI